MKKSLLIGAILGLVTTLGIALYLRDQNLLSTGSSNGNSDVDAPREPVDAPIVSVLAGFNPQFFGAEDLMMRRKNSIKPYISTADWEKTMSTYGLPGNQRNTSDCANTTLAQAVTVHPDQIEPILSGQANVLFVSNDLPRCFSTQSQVFLVVNEAVNAKSAFNIPASVIIDKVVEVSIPNLRHEVLSAMRVARDDVPSIAFGDTEWWSLYTRMTIMKISVVPGKPVIDGTVIPPFMAGVEILKPAVIASYMRALGRRNPRKPLLVDARDPRIKSSGTYPGAIDAPFLFTSPNQLKFFLDMPTSLIAGARFDISKLLAMPSNSRLIPLVVFGNDSKDASAVWVARNLQLMGYRNLFIVDGGLEALKKDAPPIIF